MIIITLQQLIKEAAEITSNIYAELCKLYKKLADRSSYQQTFEGEDSFRKVLRRFRFQSLLKLEAVRNVKLKTYIFKRKKIYFHFKFKKLIRGN